MSGRPIPNRVYATVPPLAEATPRPPFHGGALSIMVTVLVTRPAVCVLDLTGIPGVSLANQNVWTVDPSVTV